MKHLLLVSLILLCSCHSTTSKKGQENGIDSIQQQEELRPDSISETKPIPMEEEQGKSPKTTSPVLQPVSRDIPIGETINPDSLFMRTEYDYYPLSTTAEEISILTAHTSEPYLEMGVPVCYLNGRGDTIISYGKYKFCQTDTIRSIGFVYKNRSQDTRIVCINNAGKELFYVFEYDNGPDYVQEGLFRIMDEKGLIGFADTSGNVIIKPQFKFAFPFKDGKARVTLKGERKEVSESNGEKFYWESDEWFYINQKSIRLTK